MTAVMSKLKPDLDEPGADELAHLAVQGGAFDWLADEPDLYSDDDLKERFGGCSAEQSVGVTVKAPGVVNDPDPGQLLADRLPQLKELFACHATLHSDVDLAVLFECAPSLKEELALSAKAIPDASLQRGFPG